MMKNLYMKLFPLVFTAAISVYGQTGSQPQKPLAVGDTVPALVFRKMINYPDSSLSLSHFKGKAVILDFWATYCIPCIESFPKLEKLQREFKDDLQILLLSNYDENGIRRFYRNKSDLILPTAFYDHKLDPFDRLFPHREIPHYVWIDKTGRIAAITSALAIDSANITAFLKGKVCGLPVKDDSRKWGNHRGEVIDSIVHIGNSDRISINPGLMFQSMLLKYDRRLTRVQIEGIGELRGRYVALQNLTALRIMFYALGYESSRDHWRFYLDLNDSDYIAPSGLNQEQMDRWLESHCYIYRVILDRADSVRLHEVMQRDLEWTFKLRSYRAKKRLPFLALYSTGSTEALRSKSGGAGSASSSIYNITISNRPVGDLTAALYRYDVGQEFKAPGQYRLPVVDKTGISFNIDLDIRDVTVTSLAELNNKLKAYHLELRREERMMDVVVITDKQKQ